MTLGYDRVGTGPVTVLVLNDWLCDTSTWDAARVYLDQREFTWIFADLRGYGRSRELPGEYTLPEAASDVLALADALGVERFALVGHSMSTLVTMHLAQQAPERIARAVLITPAPPRGLGFDEARLQDWQDNAAGDDETRLLTWKAAWGDRLSDTWIAYKLERWRACSNVDAVVRYIRMYARDGLPEPERPIGVPILAITCEQDAPFLRKEAAARYLTPLCTQLSWASLAESGHYPMQEAPPLLTTMVQNFLRAAC